MANIKLISLGCSKNTVDSEVVLGNLKAAGHQILNEESARNPEVIIINTCGFIADAKEESIQAIIQAEILKKKRRIERLYVMGCLSQRYAHDLKNEFPLVDQWFGANELDKVIQHIAENTRFSESERHLSTPKHYAYLKIAEGCDRSCAFCAIPLIRGAHISRPIEALVDEAKQLARAGVKELIIVSQDVSYYGVDIYKRKAISDLLNALLEIPEFKWIRLNYLYPHQFPLDLLDLIGREERLCNYIDIPLQHISTRILQSMRRATDKEDTLALIEQFRQAIPDAALRTTLIVGYPGETQEEFEELMDFVRQTRFERLGVFQYSPEEDTPAFELLDDVSPEDKQERHNQIMALQEEISLENNQKKIGQIWKVLADRFEGPYVVCRSQYDAPEVDNEILVLDDDDRMNLGDFYSVKIIEADAFDLFGDLISEDL